MNGCTIVARNYLPHARVLAESFLEHHPGGTFTTLLIEPRVSGNAEEPFELIDLYELGVGRREIHRMALIYNIREFATAVKPLLLKRLLERGEVAYFDPDIQVFAALDDVAVHAREHGIVLTPHTLHELPRDGRLPDEQMILRAGVYNLGFIAVSRSASRFLEWWGDRLARDCLDAVEQGLFVDQRWVDLVPALFDHYILRDPGCNVAYWNLHGRRIDREDGRLLVDGRPLRFFHFSGYQPDRPDVLSAHVDAAPLVALDEQPEVAELSKRYGELLVERGYAPAETESYFFDRLANGNELEQGFRRIAREAILTAERTGEEPPDPYDPEEVDDFLHWLKAPSPGTRVSRYLEGLHASRTDLQAAFPDLGGADADRYLAWVRSSGRFREQVPTEFLPTLSSIRRGRMRARLLAAAARGEAVGRRVLSQSHESDRTTVSR